MSPNPLTPAVAAEKNAQASGVPLVFLYEVEVPTTPPTRVRLTSHDEEIDWRGNTYSRAPVIHSEIVEDTEGNLPSVQLSVPNLSREIGAILASTSGLVGQPVRITLISLSDIGTNQPVSEIDFTVATASVSRDSAVFRLQVFNPHMTAVPGGRITRSSCWYKFRGKRCGFALSESDTGPVTCDHTFDGENGCTAKGALYTAAGLTPIHPQRFGGFRSVPRQQSGGGGL